MLPAGGKKREVLVRPVVHKSVFLNRLSGSIPHYKMLACNHGIVGSIWAWLLFEFSVYAFYSCFSYF